MTLQEEIKNLILSWNPGVVTEFTDQTLLFEAGLLDSSALFNLILWIEEQTGEPVNAAQLDLVREWATIEAIVVYMQQYDMTPNIKPVAAAPLVSHAEPTEESPRASVNEYEIIRYSPEYDDQIAELQTGLWSQDKALNRRYLDWLYKDNPYAKGTPHIYLAIQGDQVVGMRGFWASKWEASGQTLCVLVADDLIIDPEHRNRGLHQKLMQTAFLTLKNTDYQYALNLSASPLNIMASLTMGWKSAGLLELAGRPSVDSIFPGIRAALQQTPGLWRFSNSSLFFSKAERQPFLGIDQHANNPLIHGNRKISATKNPDMDAMCGLIESLPCNNRIRHVKNEQYLNWRYNNPRADYRYIYSRTKSLDGYLAISYLTGNTADGGRTGIVDFEARDDATLAALISYAAKYFNKLVLWTGTLDKNQLSCFKENGFLPIDPAKRERGCPALLIRALQSDPDHGFTNLSLDDLNSWDLRMIYSMNG
ncbi:MAG: GNAT family N-acetyltransferase [Gammaproteobacteria bacterium]|nr:GNAT family N-acetyltransferase [Gammaproteobacteria bacterium]